MENKKLNIMIVGAGLGGTSLLSMFKNSATINIIGIVDPNTDAPGIQLAQKLCIPTSTTWETFIKLDDLDEIFDVTGSLSVFKQLLQDKPKHVGILGGPSSKMIWQLLDEHAKNEQDLVTEKKRAENYLDISGALIVALDRDGIVTLINRSGCVLLGYDKELVLGKNWFETFIPNDTQSIARDVFTKNMGGPSTLVEHFENEILRADGTLRHISWHNALVYNENNEIAGTLSSGEDITERKKMEEALKEKVHSLEIYQKASVGRETKMIELKEHIKRLEQEITSLKNGS